MINTNIGERIKQARQQLGYSAEQVAEFLHVSPTTIYRYENGDISKLPAKHVKPLAGLLGISPEHLMGWDEENKNDQEKPQWEKVKPKTIEAKIVSFGMDELPQQQRQMIVNMVTAMFPDTFKDMKGTENNDT